MQSRRPTKAQVEAAYGRRIKDVLAPGLRVVFVGINPGLYSGAVGHHFARPGNRFWKTLHKAGFTDRELSPFEDRQLLRYGVGVTNLVARTTRAAEELTPEELALGARRLERKICQIRPKVVAFVGVTAYRTAFRRPKASIGPQPEGLCAARIWVLPNTSGRTAAYRPADFVKTFAQLRAAVDSS